MIVRLPSDGTNIEINPDILYMNNRIPSRYIP